MITTELQSIPFNNLSWQWQAIEEKFLPELHQLMSEGHFCLGPAVEQFEHEFAKYIGAAFAIGVNSGTSALHLSLIGAGIQPGDKVLIPAQTFVATAWAILYVGAIPILCDVEEATGNICIEDAERRVEPRTKAIIPVHLYGQPANMEKILNFAKAHHLKIIEDASQADGAKFQDQSIGTFGSLGCFSFYPGKNLGAMGEAGMIVTADEAIAKRLRALRQHAQYERYIHEEIGFNYRMEGIQGLVLSHKLPFLDGWTQLRRQIAKRYLIGLEDLPLQLPTVIHHDHVYHLFVIRSPKREALRQWLLERHIATGLHYPVPLHRQPCFKHLNFNVQDYPNADHYSNHGLSLPLFPGMTDTQVDIVIHAIRDFFKENK